MPLIHSPQSPQRSRDSRHFVIFGPLPFFWFGLEDSLNPLALTTISFVILGLLFLRKNSREIFSSGILIGLSLALMVFWVKMNWLDDYIDTVIYYRLTQLTYFVAALMAFVIGGLNFYDWWMLRRYPTSHKAIFALPTFAPTSGYQPWFVWSLLAVSSIALGLFLGLMQSVYPSSPYLQGMISTLLVHRLRMELQIYVAVYSIALILPFLGMVWVSSKLFDSKPFQLFFFRRPSLIRAVSSAVFFSLGVGLIYLLNQPFLGG